MKSVIKILTNPLLISVIGLIALAVIVWFGGPVIGINDSRPLESEMPRLLTILAITVLWGLNNFRVQNVQKKKDSAMMGEIAQSASLTDKSDSGVSEEVKAIQQHFNEALNILKASKKHKQGDNIPIHELPWYIIIGPPGSGKTTALINSGLRFPLAEKMGQQPLKGIGGTRNCDWWFSDDAILIDTAGRYTTQDSDKSADSTGWKGFLKLLRKHRPRQPINGAIVAISLTELLSQSESERQEHAHLIKQRLQELYDNLGIQFPVYVILTKTDLIAGFNEFFDSLSRNDREQIWGMTFPASSNFESNFDLAYFKEQYDALLRRLSSRLQWRLQEERDLSRRALILNFPVELSSLKEMLSHFMDSIFRPSSFDKPVNLRGVYFTSGTQEGTPIDRVMGALAANFGLNRQTMPSYSGQGKSFFLTQLFRNVIFPEALIAGTNRIYEQKQRWSKRIAYVVALLITAASAGVWTSQYTAIKAEMNKLDAQIEDYRQKSSALPAKINNPEILLSSLEILRTASTVVSNENRSLFSQAGLSQMHSLGPATDDAYERSLIQQFYPSLVATLEDSLSERSTPLDSLFITLKTYLMLADEKRFDKKEISAWFQKRWEQEFAGNAAKQTTLKTHLDNLFKLDISPIATKPELVAEVRVKLQKIPLSQRIYTTLKQSGSNRLQDFFLSDVLDTQELQLLLNKSNSEEPIKGIPGLYTKEGYESYFREESINLAQASTEDDWVFGKVEKNKKSVIDPDQIHLEVEQLYITDFIKQWDSLFNSIKLARFKNIEQGVDMLQSLSGEESVLVRVVDSININTDLRSKPNLLQEVGEENLKKLGSLGKKAAKKVKSDVPLTPVGNKLREHYEDLIGLTDSVDNKPAGIQKHLVSLAKLQGYLNEIMVASEPKSAALEASIKRMNSNGKDIIGTLQRDAKRLPNPVADWINDIAVNSWRILLTDSYDYINESWNNQIVARYEQAIKNRYPVFKAATQNTSLKDFSDFFAPDGLYLGFIKKNIFPFLNTQGNIWKNKTLEGQGLPLSQNTIQQLQQGQIISKAFFANNPDSISVKFQITPVKLDASVSRVNLVFDKEEITYRHGPVRASNLSWPFSEEYETSKVSIQFFSGSNNSVLRKNGTWALFQLLDEASIKSSNTTDKYSVSFTVDGFNAKYTLQAGSIYNPFNLDDLHSFRVPGKL